MEGGGLLDVPRHLGLAGPGRAPEEGGGRGEEVGDGGARRFDDVAAAVKGAVEGVAGVGSCKVDLVWDPPWTKDRISEAAKLELGLL